MSVSALLPPSCGTTGFGLLMGFDDNGERRGEQDKSNLVLTREQWGEEVRGEERRVCLVYDDSGLFVDPRRPSHRSVLITIRGLPPLLILLLRTLHVPLLPDSSSFDSVVCVILLSPLLLPLRQTLPPPPPLFLLVPRLLLLRIFGMITGEDTGLSRRCGTEREGGQTDCEDKGREERLLQGTEGHTTLLPLTLLLLLLALAPPPRQRPLVTCLIGVVRFVVGVDCCFVAWMVEWLNVWMVGCLDD